MFVFDDCVGRSSKIHIAWTYQIVNFDPVTHYPSPNTHDMTIDHKES